MRGRWEPVGRIALYSVFEINFSLFSCSNRRCIRVTILAVLSLLTAGPRSRNLVVSFRIVLVLVEDNDTRSFVEFCYDDVFIHPERTDNLKTFFCH